jgi:cytoskeletal protein CcmA (bactofilin family)
MFQKPAYEPEYQEAPPMSVSSGNDSVETIVGPSMHVEGDFSSEGNITIKGSVAGSIQTSQLIRVEEGARIHANVKAGSAVISGQVKGNIRADDRLEITSSAQILGDIQCVTIAIEPGAILQGKITMPGLEIEGGAAQNKKVKSRKIRSDEVEVNSSDDEVGLKA